MVELCVCVLLPLPLPSPFGTSPVSWWLWRASVLVTRLRPAGQTARKMLHALGKVSRLPPVFGLCGGDLI